MTRDEITHMAREAGFVGMDGDHGALRRFAALVAAAEREACIVDIQWHIPRSGRHTPEYQMAMKMIERIRARGNSEAA